MKAVLGAIASMLSVRQLLSVLALPAEPCALRLQEWSDYLFPLKLPAAYKDALPNR